MPCAARLHIAGVSFGIVRRASRRIISDNIRVHRPDDPKPEPPSDVKTISLPIPEKKE
jgi:hypothetical protein